ncbi:MAG: hypothetical protein A4E39_00407 [Methanoregulaceae archaeon PtaB.Bin152]|nr:MAG: hypothetical protein A4E39_00407 [Methanoregulaceae archaeon PtaB.Bin152]
MDFWLLKEQHPDTSMDSGRPRVREDPQLFQKKTSPAAISKEKYSDLLPLLFHVRVIDVPRGRKGNDGECLFEVVEWICLDLF